MKRRLFQLFLICLVLAFFSVAANAGEIFSVTAGVKDIGTEILKHTGAQVTEGFILVPEPSSILLFSSGVLALLGYRSKRNLRKRQE